MSGIELITNERNRQLEKWNTRHDDEHTDGSLAVMAATLALNGTDACCVDDALGRGDCWGLLKKHKSNRVRQLVIAGALIAAEIDREFRKTQKD